MLKDCLDLIPKHYGDLGVPLFQEQLLRIAMAISDFTGGEAEELRREPFEEIVASRVRGAHAFSEILKTREAANTCNTDDPDQASLKLSCCLKLNR